MSARALGGTGAVYVNKKQSRPYDVLQNTVVLKPEGKGIEALQWVLPEATRNINAPLKSTVY